jgi:glucose/arabinose dehydrogenase
VPRVEVIGENLTIPWEVVFLPDGEILVTERPGRVLLLKAGIGLAVPDVQSTGEGGLLGAVLHPDFEANNYLYLYQTTEDGLGLKNRIVRYILRNNTITLDRVIADNLPGARFHDGGRIAFGPDGYLYVTVGDALRPSEAQDENTLEGTLLRMTDAGEPAPGNPFGSLVYSYGHRNAQGLAWDEAGNLWSSEHGRSVGGSGFDEINLITPGSNYGWPDSQGDTVAAGTVAPARHSTADVTWAPGGLAYFAGSLYMPGLRGETLYEAVLDGTEIVAWHEHLVGEYNRLRTVVVGPDNLLYLTTSNRDGRLQGEEPIDTDDRIIRINPAKLTR